MQFLKRLKIRVEKHELKIISLEQNSKLYCPICELQTNHLTVEKIAQIFSISEISIFRLVENKQIHSIETAQGKLKICVDSASNYLQI